MIRFNKKGQFNVPFCQKPNRFSKAYITKICNQIQRIYDVMEGKDWEFRTCPWQETMEQARESDYVYLDPPYIGRDTCYVGEWPDSEAVSLADYAKKFPLMFVYPCGKKINFALMNIFINIGLILRGLIQPIFIIGWKRRKSPSYD